MTDVEGDPIVSATGADSERAVVAIAAGKDHSLVLRDDGRVFAWGNNDDGQCDIPDELVNVDAISAGGFHSLALTTDGTVVAWGGNLYRQCEVPRTLRHPVAICAGHWHSLALQDDGTVVAWGRNSELQSTVVQDLSDVTAIAAGYEHSVALRGDGTVVVWGRNSHGQCEVPPGLSDVIAISAGAWQSFALRSNGTVVAWGASDNGQTAVPTVSGLSGVAGGYWHGVALSSGRVVSWGDNEFGQATGPLGLTDAVALAAGGEHTIALRRNGVVVAWGRNDRGQADVGLRSRGRHAAIADRSGAEPGNANRVDIGQVWGWGSNEEGQLGYRSERDCPAPSHITGLPPIARLFVHGDSAFATDTSGSAWAWGRNNYGELGDGSTVDRHAPVALVGPTGVVAIVPPTYAIVEGGRLWSWGTETSDTDPSADQLQSAPTHVNELRDVKKVVRGQGFSVALTLNGTVWTWGSNQHGQLGDGTEGGWSAPSSADRRTPSQAKILAVRRPWLGKAKEVEEPLANVVDIVVAESSVYALLADGSVWAWGLNGRGQLGDGSRTSRSRPVKLAGLPEIGKVVVCPGQSYAIARDGSVWGWQWLSGAGEGVTPSPVAGLHDVANVIPAGYPGRGLSYALTNSGQVLVWGENRVMPVVEGSGNPAKAPQRVVGLTGIVALELGRDCALALSTDGSVWIWGVIWSQGRGTPKALPERVPGLEDVTQIAVGAGGSTGESFYALKADATVWAWGKNDHGQLGIGDQLHSLRPVRIAVEGVLGIAGGGNTCFAITADHTLAAWGSNEQNKLAIDVRQEPGPIWHRVFGLADVKSVASSYYSTLTLTTAGSVWMAGGTATGWEESRPLKVDELDEISEIAIGANTYYALDRDGSVWAWGDSTRNQIGDGAILVPGQSMSGLVAARLAPVRVKIPERVATIASGRHTGYALAESGEVWAWGDNEFGQLGDGEHRESRTYSQSAPWPARVSGLNEVTAIAAGSRSAYALKSDGTVWAWGSNDDGQVGDGSSGSRRLLPVQLNLPHIKFISASDSSAYAIGFDGTVWVWGCNRDGQLGDGTQLNRRTPIQVSVPGEVRAVVGVGATAFALVSPTKLE